MSGSNPSGVFNGYPQATGTLPSSTVFLIAASYTQGALMYNCTLAQISAAVLASGLGSPGPIGNVTPSTGAFTTVEAGAGSSYANNITLAGGAASFTPSITAAGSDTNVSLNLFTQGTGTVNIGGNNCTVNQGGTLTAQSVTANPITAGTFVVGTSAGPNIITGAGVPGFTEPKGSIYLRTGGGVGSTLYVSQGGGTWNAVAGV